MNALNTPKRLHLKREKKQTKPELESLNRK
jgi:hypothetical protein